MLILIKKLKILIIATEYPPLGAGAANALQQMMQYWGQSAAIEVVVLTGAAGEDQVIHCANGSRIELLDHGKNGQKLQQQSISDLLQLSHRLNCRAQELLESERFDLIHAIFALPCGVICRRLSHQFSLPYTVSLRGSDVPMYNRKYNLLMKLGLRQVFARVLRDAAAVTANSQSLAGLAGQSADVAIDVIGNGIDHERFSASKSIMPDDGTIRVLTVGRIVEQKRIDQIIESLVHIPQARLEIAGSGSKQTALQQLARDREVSDRVVWLGHLSGDELLAAYARNHVFVLVSHNEGMSNALLEAVASGFWCICSNTGDARNCIGAQGVVLDQVTPQALATALQNSPQDYPLQPLPSWSIQAEKYLEFWQQALHR